ncbi:ATP synthase F1 subunit epsilon [Candidatus Peregrinibacteria bacterium]|nr:ATP synthase F1 subunit epsilon [Candidatus Peregrinibacteria bacterium]
MAFKFQIITPEKIIHTGAADSVSVPTFEGEITILSHHMPLVSAVRVGVLRVKHGKEEVFIAIDGGILKMDKGGLVILAESAQRADELIEEQIQKALDEAKKAKEAKRMDTSEFVQALAMIERETAKLKALRRYKGSRGAMGPSNE